MKKNNFTPPLLTKKRENKKKERAGFIKFLGTAGARFVMINQLRASGGIWISFEGKNLIIDPGPGSIVRSNASRPRLNPVNLDAIILTHRHLDHAADINVMIEAMTEGGFKKRGIVYLPEDALVEDGIVLKYLQKHVEKFEILKPNTSYELGKLKFATTDLLKHQVKTFGFNFRLGKKTISLISDTDYFKGLENFFDNDIVIINVVFFETRDDIEHLSLPEAKSIIEKLKPKKTILTHFGMTMLKNKPHILAEKLSEELNLDIVSAYDGMALDI